MEVVERSPRKFKAVQFNKEGDFPGVERGYIQTRNGHQAIFISDAMPRSIDCKFCYVIEIDIARSPVFIGDWILVEINSPKDKRKVVSNKKFLKKYMDAGTVLYEKIEQMGIDCFKAVDSNSAHKGPDLD